MNPAVLHPHGNFRLRQRHSKRRTIKNDLMRFESNLRRKLPFDVLSLNPILMKPSDDVAPPAFSDIDGENEARLIEVPPFETRQ